MSLGYPTDYLCFKLSKVYRNVQRYYETYLSNFGLTPVQFFVINILISQDGMKFKDLALELSIEGATLTGLLDRMERAELLRRSPDPDDRRSILVFLTSKGQEVGSQLKSLVVDLDSNIRNQFSEEEYNQFLLVLDSMVVPDQL